MATLAKKNLTTMKPLILAIILLLIGYSTNYSQCITADSTFQHITYKASVEAKNGQYLPTSGMLRVLVIYMEIEYDNPNNAYNDPLPLGTTIWPKNDLPTYKDNLFDQTWTGAPQGILTKYFAECSFSNFQVIGDYVDQIITVKESELPYFSEVKVRQNAFAQLNAQGTLNTHGGRSIQDFDNWLQKSPGEVSISGSDTPYSYDHVILVFRNYKNAGLNEGAGYTSPGLGAYSSQDKILGYGADTYECIVAGGHVPFNIIRHEFSHNLFGNNNFHTNGSHSAGGTTFISDQQGWSMMGGKESSFQTCNAWDRDRMAWKNPGKNMTISATDLQGNEVNTNLDATNSNHAGIYVLRDFVTSGDALRIKLPFIPATEYQEYLWIENHLTGANNNSPFDHFLYENHSCMTSATPGMYMYLQAGKDIKEGVGTFGQHGHYLRFLPANGLYDLQFENTLQQSTCIGWNWFPPFEKQPLFANPLTGAIDLEKPACDKNNDNIINRAEHRELIIEKINGQYYNNLPYLGHSHHAFTLNGNHRIGMGTNPSSNSMITLERDDVHPIHSGKDHRVIRLNGIQITLLEELSDGSIKVEVKFNHSDIENDTRWCGNVELPPIYGYNGYSLNLKQGNTILLDQGYTPTRVDTPMVLKGEKYFVEPTRFTCLNNAYFHVEQNATVNVISNSTLHLKPGAKMELESGAKLYIGPHSRLIIDDGATLSLKPGAILEIDEEATVEYQNHQTGTGLLVGSTSFTGNPATVLVKGTIQFSLDAKWEHERDGIYHFYPSYTLTIPSSVPIQFTGKGKTRTMMVLEDHTTLSFNNHDMDWHNGQIVYGNHSAVELNGVDFTSLNCTYNPNSNSTTGSTGLVIENPTFLLLNGCNFYKMNKGLNIQHIRNGVSTTVKNCLLANHATIGIMVQQSSQITISGGQISGNGSIDLSVSDVELLTVNTTEIKNTPTGVILNSVVGAYFNGANIHDNTTGINAYHSLVFLRNGTKVHHNMLYGVNINGAYDYSLGNYTAMLTIGDVGCGNIYNNPNTAVYAYDALLNIDAEQHAIDRGDLQVTPNRFDHNGVTTFEVCYGNNSFAPSQINAKGNFWGTNPAEITTSQYSITANGCSPSANLVNIPLIHSNYSTCFPSSSCFSCYNTSSGWGTIAPNGTNNSSDGAVQASFSNANTPFITQDNSLTRSKFTHLSAVSLVKDISSNSWQVQSINNQTFSLNNTSVHQIQVSKALKAVSSQFSGRTTVIPEDIFKGIQPNPQKLSSSNSFRLYPNPIKDQLIIDLENQDASPRLKIYNMTGKLMMETTLRQKHNILEMSSLPTGIYYYSFSTANLHDSFSGKLNVVQ